MNEDPTDFHRTDRPSEENSGNGLYLGKHGIPPVSSRHQPERQYALQSTSNSFYKSPQYSYGYGQNYEERCNIRFDDRNNFQISSAAPTMSYGNAANFSEHQLENTYYRSPYSFHSDDLKSDPSVSTAVPIEQASNRHHESSGVQSPNNEFNKLSIFNSNQVTSSPIDMENKCESQTRKVSLESKISCQDGTKHDVFAGVVDLSHKENLTADSYSNEQSVATDKPDKYESENESNLNTVVNLSENNGVKPVEEKVDNTYDRVKDSPSFKEIKLEITNEINEAVSESEEIDPFVCGICKTTFSDFVMYTAHLKSHNIIEPKLHSCSTNDRNSDGSLLYTCVHCGIAFPSVCLLETHIVEIERPPDFIICGMTRKGYLLSDETIQHLDELLQTDLLYTARQDQLAEEELEDNDGKQHLQGIKATKPKKSSKARKSAKTNLSKRKKVNKVSQVRSKRRKISQLKHSRTDTKSIKEDDAVEDDSDDNLPKPEDVTVTSGADEKPENEIKTEADLGEKETWYDESDAETVDLDMDTEWMPTVEATEKTSTTKKRRQLGPRTNPPISCELCGKIIKKKNMKNHMLTHETEGKATRNIKRSDSAKPVPIPCDLCGKLIQRKNVSHHRKVHLKHKDNPALKGGKPETLPCETCGKVIKRRRWNDHIRTHFPERHDALVPCEICGKSYNRNSMRSHIKTHYPPRFHCNICGLGCRTKSGLDWHVSHVHATESNFTCDKCGKAFKGPHYLKQHYLTHKTTREWKCTKCPKAYVVRQCLRVHMLSHTDERPFTCEVCGKGFKSKGRLGDHNRWVHTEGTPFSCSYCGKGFKVKKELLKHEKIHKPPENFCPCCGRGFVMKDNMKTHIKSQHPHFDLSTLKAKNPALEYANNP